MSTIRTGVAAPDFELKDQNGSTVRLRDFRGKGPVVVYFYPKDDTTGCTAEACAFRDQYERFRAYEATVLGISSDNAESHQKFIAKYNLPFTLLSDPTGEVRKAYGALAFLGLMPGRSTIVIDQEGIVQHVFTSQLEFTKHCDEALKAIGG